MSRPPNTCDSDKAGRDSGFKHAEEETDGCEPGEGTARCGEHEDGGPCYNVNCGCELHLVDRRGGIKGRTAEEFGNREALKQSYAWVFCEEVSKVED